MRAAGLDAGDRPVAGRVRRRRGRSGSRSSTSASSEAEVAAGEPGRGRRSGTRSSTSTTRRAPLRRIRAWLRPGGALVVAVPNLGGLQARIGGDRWFHQDVPRHRDPSHAAPALTALLERSGFGSSGCARSLVEQNPLGMWQTLLNRLTARARLRLPGAQARPRRRRPRRPGAATWRVTAGRRRRCWPRSRSRLELAAGLAGRGGSIVVEATARREAERLRPRPWSSRPLGGEAARADARLARRAAVAHQTIVVDNGSPSGDVGRGLRRAARRAPRCCARAQRRLHPRGQPRRPARRRRGGRPAQRRLRLRPELRRADLRARSIRPPGSRWPPG